MAKDAGGNRGVKQAHFLVLIGANMPSVLAEINFITNPQEERLLKTAKYRQHVAETMYEGIVRFFEDREQERPAVVARGVGR